MSDPDTSVSISGDTLTIRTGNRFRTIHVPGFSGLGIVPNGPGWHFYDSADWATQAGPYGVSRQIIWTNLKEDSAPNFLLSRKDRPVVNGERSSVPGLGTVVHYLNDADNVIVNVTTPTHRLSPGIVIRLLDEVNGQWVITTIGFGNGPLGGLNELMSDWLWSGSAEQIGRESVYEQARGGRLTRISFVQWDNAPPPPALNLPPEYSVVRDARGGFHVVNRADGMSVAVSQAPGTLGRMAGSSLGNYIASDVGTLGQIAASTVLGSIGEAFGNALSIQSTLPVKDLSKSFDAAFSNFDQTLYNNLKAASVGALTSVVTMELGRALGLKGFGAELFNQVSGTAVGPVLDKIVTNLAAGQVPFKDFSLKEIFGGTGSFGDLLGAGLASFFGAKLGALVISPTTQAGAALASLGSAAGAYALSAAGSKAIGGIAAQIFGKLGAFGNILGPGIGAFVGFVLGALLGKLFGKARPRIPIASADVTLNLSTTTYEVGAITSANNGNRALVTNMAIAARDSLNGVIGSIVGGSPLFNTNFASPTQTYGHQGGQIRARFMNGAWQNFDSADKAVDWGVLNAIRSTQIRGGDIFQKRVLSNPTITSIASLFGNIQIAADYGHYLRNRETINRMIRDNPRSEMSAAWIITLGRVQELGINEWKPSDFYGGLAGFSESFGFGIAGWGGALGRAYEDLTLAFEGTALRITAAGTQGPFELLSGSNNITDPALAARSAYIANFGSNVGYTPWTGQATAGNDIWIASGGGAVTMDDSGMQMQGYWHPYFGYWQYPVYVSGGDDIFVGSSFNDVLYGRAGWDWLDGGAGQDTIYGGDNDDVLLGRGGVDYLYGEAGNDYLAGGDGDDHPTHAGSPFNGGLLGGNGDDILVGGAGIDAVWGEADNDLIIVDEDGGGIWDYYDGGSGSDTASYERFGGGVWFDMFSNQGYAGHYSTITYGDGFVSVENVTGSQHNDWIAGDSGANLLKGLRGDDQLHGRDGDDVLEGGGGADALFGGNGSDTASYETSQTGVSVDLSVGMSLGGDASGDTFSSIENVRGSQFDDDLTGDAGDNVLTGLRGDDWFTMTAGNDTLNGGAGLDTLDASGAAAGLTVYYDAGYWGPYYQYPGAGWVATVSGLGTSILSGIESFVGTAHADWFSGDIADEVFEGGAGNDTFYGSSGSDTYVFGRGDNYDVIHETADGANAIMLKSGINWRDVAIDGAAWWAQNGNLVITIRGTSDQIVAASNFSYVNSGGSAGNHNHRIKALDLAGVSTIDLDRIDSTPWAADEGGTVVYGAQNRADLIFAYGGNDTIFTAGNSSNYETRGNVVYAGDGNDTIYGSGGDDQYIFERGNGADWLTDIGGVDTLVMGPSVLADDVIYEVVTTNAGSGGWGASADLYIGIRDANNPNLKASQVADRILIAGGGTKMVGLFYGSEQINTIEHVRVGGHEIDLLKSNINWVTSYYYDGGYWPIGIDLDGDGIELRSVDGSRVATVAADGTVLRVGWVGPDDGFLALDRDGSGTIDRMAEISFIGDLEGAKTDLEGLAAHDSNGDGVLDAGDARWGEFLVWQDKNQDGFGDKNELVSLEQAGIRSIGLKGQATGFTSSDSLDTTVIATTEIGWADKDRTGSGYDLRLGALQVRTDVDGRNAATRSDGARRLAEDPLDAKLTGVQMLTETQARQVRDAARHADQALGGRLHRIETLLGNGAAVVDGGFYRIDPDAASAMSAAMRGGGKGGDPFATSAWTLAGSIQEVREPRDKLLDQLIERPVLDRDRQAVVDAARSRVAEERRAADEAAAGLARRAELEAGADRARMVSPPSKEALARLKRNDPFRLLPAEGGGDPGAAARDATTPERLMAEFESMQALQTPNVSPGDDRRSLAPVPIDDLDPVAAVGSLGRQDVLPLRATGERTIVEPELDYRVTITAANARLVQALATFGNTPAMLASYRGLNIANDPEAHWLTVDRITPRQAMIGI